MRTYNPDLWTLLKISGPEGKPIFKILGSWYGGFAGSNSWRLSSGCLTPTVTGGTIVWPQSSGSVYEVHLSNVGMSGYTQSVLSSLEGTAKEQNCTIEVIDFAEFPI